MNFERHCHRVVMDTVYAIDLLLKGKYVLYMWINLSVIMLMSDSINVVLLRDTISSTHALKVISLPKVHVFPCAGQFARHSLGVPG